MLKCSIGELYVWPQMRAFLVFGARLKQRAELGKAAFKTGASLEELKWKKCDTTAKRSPAGQMCLEVLHALTDVAKVQIPIQEGMDVFCRTYLILIQNLKVHVTLLPSCWLMIRWATAAFLPLYSFLPPPFLLSFHPRLNYLNISHLCLIAPHSSSCI